MLLFLHHDHRNPQYPKEKCDFLTNSRGRALPPGNQKMTKTSFSCTWIITKRHFFALCLNDDHTIPECSLGNLLFVTKSGGLRLHNNIMNAFICFVHSKLTWGISVISVLPRKHVFGCYFLVTTTVIINFLKEKW